MFFDTHAHLDQEEFAGDLPEVIERARLAGVERVVAVGVTARSSLHVVELAAEHVGMLRAAVGIQPNYTAEAEPSDWDAVVELATRPEVVAVGETGLDHYWDHSPIDTQRDYFDRHLRLSQANGKPFIVHTRASDADVLAMLREARRRGPLAGVMHSFTGTAETADECVELGLYVSFAGMVTFKKSADLRRVAATIPLDRLLIETDSPYLSPEPRRGRRNEPSHLIHTAKCLAEARGMPFESLATATTNNARRLFGWGD